jgi:Planctomycete cytochrome C
MNHRIALVFLSFAVSPALYAQLGTKPTVDFNRHVRPILSKHCYDCHSVAKKKEKAGFVFDDIKRLANDVGPGRIIVPKSVDESDLIPIVLGSDGKKLMPPEGRDQLSEKEVNVLRKWIEEGANLPGVDIAAKMAKEKRDRPKSLMNWTNREGKALKAYFEGVEGPSVLLRTEEGKIFKYPLANLNEAGKIQVQLQME